MFTVGEEFRKSGCVKSKSVKKVSFWLRDLTQLDTVQGYSAISVFCLVLRRCAVYGICHACGDVTNHRDKTPAKSSIVTARCSAL